MQLGQTGSGRMAAAKELVVAVQACPHQAAA